LGSDPALIGVVFRPPSEPEHGSHTYWNIRETGVFTINHVGQDFYKRAHQASARYPESSSEFDELGFTPIYRCGFEAPAVEEAPVRLGLERVDEWKIPQNECRFVVGQIRWVEFPETAWAKDGYLDLEGLGVIALSSLDGYHITKKLSRLAYAKPDQTTPECEPDFMKGWEDA
jgi:flavin reductase (DIM6/NTAB) family NADH-FMN oxidoreductase RutF